MFGSIVIRVGMVGGHVYPEGGHTGYSRNQPRCIDIDVYGLVKGAVIHRVGTPIKAVTSTAVSRVVGVVQIQYFGMERQCAGTPPRLPPPEGTRKMDTSAAQSPVLTSKPWKLLNVAPALMLMRPKSTTGRSRIASFISNWSFFGFVSEPVSNGRSGATVLDLPAISSRANIVQVLLSRKSEKSYTALGQSLSRTNGKSYQTLAALVYAAVSHAVLPPQTPITVERRRCFSLLKQRTDRGAASAFFCSRMLGAPLQKLPPLV